MTPADETLLRSRCYELWLDVRVPMPMLFDRLATPDGLPSWWVDDAAVQGTPPTLMRLVWGTGEQALVQELTILTHERPERLVCQWTSLGGRPIIADGSNIRGSHVPIIQRFELTDVTSTLTRLHLLDSGFGVDAAWDGIYRTAIDRWDRALTKLISVCESGQNDRRGSISPG